MEPEFSTRFNILQRSEIGEQFPRLASGRRDEDGDDESIGHLVDRSVLLRVAARAQSRAIRRRIAEFFRCPHEATASVLRRDSLLESNRNRNRAP